MAFESFQLNLKLTDYGYQRVMALDGKPVSIKFISLGKGNSSNSAGYAVDFRDTKTELVSPVVTKQIDSSKKESYVEDGSQLARIDTATIFSGDEDFDVRELAFFDEDDEGNPGSAVYIWSSPDEIYAPKRPRIHLVVSISQHLLFSDEASAVTVIDAGLPFELFLQPLKDDFTDQLNAVGMSFAASLAGMTASHMQSTLRQQAIRADLDEQVSALSQQVTDSEQARTELSSRFDSETGRLESDLQSLQNAMRTSSETQQVFNLQSTALLTSVLNRSIKNTIQLGTQS